MSRARKRTGRRRTVAGALACAAFVLQQLLVPLHLAFNDHVYVGVDGEDVHSHWHTHDGHAHRHGAEHSTPQAPDRDHQPHPAADHLDTLAEPALPPALAFAPIGPAPQGVTPAAPEGPSLPRPEDAPRGPRPPPPRVAAAPRAPPVVA